MAVRAIHGPIISCADLEAQRALFEGVYGLEPVAEQSLNRTAVHALWGVDESSAETVLLETPGTHFGVRLIRFDPVSALVIRDPASGFNSDALKVIDFYAPDFAAAQQRLEYAGFKLKDDIAEYDLPEGRFIEGHLWGPDEVVTALVSGPSGFFRDFATTTDKLFSEVQSVSSPVSDMEAVVEFYARVLGLGVVHEYAIDDDSFADLVGTSHKLQLRARNIGLRRTEPYFGIIHYGLPDTAYTSLKDRAILPNRGLAGATVLVTSAEEVAAQAATHRAEVTAPLTEAELAPYGGVKSLGIRGPHGVFHHVVETH